MTVTIINDCRDANAQGRQITRAQSILECPAAFIGVSSDLEAAGNLVDALDALEEREGVVLVNVAPRHGMGKHYPNGTPFCYFHYKNTLVVCSRAGFTLSLIKKLNLVKKIFELDIPQTLSKLVSQNLLPPHLYDHITHTQFRSFEYLPRIAAFLLKKIPLPAKKIDTSSIFDAPSAVWWVDNFGNCKTTMLEHQLIKTDALAVHTARGDFPFYPRLKDVPDTVTAVVIGSSGIGSNRFAEIVTQGGNTSHLLSVQSGTRI